MEIGVIYPQMEFEADPKLIRDYVQAVEDMGFAHISAYEHILGINPKRPGRLNQLDSLDDTFFEPFVLFSYMAGITKKVFFATRILILPQRQTTLVAKQAATLDVLCNGRFRLGVGLGWNELEYSAQNEIFSTRAQRIEEQVDILRKLWTQPLVNYSGKWHSIQDVGINPLPVQRPIQVWFGGHTNSTVQRAARIGDGWMPNDLSIEDIKPLIDLLERYLAENQRDFTKFGIDARVPYSKDEDTLAKVVNDWRTVGATHLSFDTMGCGFKKPENHLEALRLVGDNFLG